MIQTSSPLLLRRAQPEAPARPRTGALLLPDGAQMSFLELGQGPRTLVFLPGAGDGVADASQASASLSVWLRNKARYFRVIYLSRRSSQTRVPITQHAEDVAHAMDALQLGPSIIEAQSAGGPIGQLLAASRPDLVATLALSSSTAHLDDQARSLCNRWLEHIRAGRWDAFFQESAELLWRDNHRSLLRAFQHTIQRRIQPQQPRIESILFNLLALDHRTILPCIEAPTLVVGGAQDLIFSAAQQTSMAEAIPNARLLLHPDHGHGQDLENPKHDETLAAFARLHAKRFR